MSNKQPEIKHIDHPEVPEIINQFDLEESARFLHQMLGYAVHPLQPHNRGAAGGRGKKPLLQGWREHNALKIDEGYLKNHFGSGSQNNIGCVLSGNQVVIDLDSKSDSGKSVDAWLSEQTNLSGFPRERTAGGVHIHMRCDDLPEWAKAQKKAAAIVINDKVTAELYTAGLNIAMSPSIHASGHRYHWEKTGQIQPISWQQLTQPLPFRSPEQNKVNEPRKDWWKKRDEDLRTLDLVAMLDQMGVPVECLDADNFKFSVPCPWAEEHSNVSEKAGDSSTVFFNVPQQFPGFSCLHSHCHGRKMEQFLDWADSLHPGIVAAHCAGKRSDTTGPTGVAGRVRVLLAGRGHSQIEFGKNLGGAVAPANLLFTFQGRLVLMHRPNMPAEACSDSEILPGTVMMQVTATQLITLVEEVVDVGIMVTKQEEKEFMLQSMSLETARVTMENRSFLDCLPRVRRVLQVPIPHLSEDGGIAYPKLGYDDRFETWLDPDAPAIQPMTLNAAIDLIRNKLFMPAAQGGFCWKNEQAFIHAVARLLTPFCRALMNWKRPPFWVFDGNREGCGKDTCASVALVLYTGRAVRCAPLPQSADDEMRKRITSALLTGSQFFHLANMKGHIDFPSLESVTDNLIHIQERILGSSNYTDLVNEMEYSASTNHGTWSPDLARRARTITLFYAGEDVNDRQFTHPDILGWVGTHRSELLSALASMVEHWVGSGRPSGPSNFSSFPEWARIVGGIMTCCGFGDPCLPHEENDNSGDTTTIAVKSLFHLAFETFHDSRVAKPEFQKFLASNPSVAEFFDWLDLSQKSGLASLGKVISRFRDRELGGIVMNIRQTSKNHMTYEFLRVIPENDTKRGVGEEEGETQVTPGDPALPETSPVSIAEVPQPVSQNSLPLPASLHRAYCNEVKHLELVASGLSDATRIALDIETYGRGKKDGLNPWRGEIRLLTLYAGCGTVWLVDLKSVGYELGALKGVLERSEIIAHNAKFDLLWLLEKCGISVSRVHCTMTASRMLSAGNRYGNNLDQCLERYLGVKPAPDLSLSNWSADVLSTEQIAYAVRDVTYLHPLLCQLESHLEHADMGLSWEFESQLLPDVVRIEHNGIHVEPRILQSIIDASGIEMARSTETLRKILEEPGLNPASPAQLLEALVRQGVKLTSTKEEELKGVTDHPAVDHILCYRQASKKSQQAAALLKHIEEDGRIHARFEPMGTETGRFSSKSPNLQSVGHGTLREAFSAPEGRALITADYSQIELRIAAVVANETKMISAYQSDLDLHRLTASSVLGKPVEEVDKNDRQLAKAVNFGLLYGQNAEGLVRYAASSFGVEMKLEYAEYVRERFFKGYPRVKKWHHQAWNDSSSDTSETRTLTGRRRIVPLEKSRWDRFTSFVNTPVQGGAAEVMKTAIFIAMGRLPAHAKVVATIHDELLIECDENQAEGVRGLIVDSMTEAMGVYYPKVPCVVEAKICANWAEK